MTAFRQGGSELSRMCRDSVSRVPEALQAWSPVASAAPLALPNVLRHVRCFDNPGCIQEVSQLRCPDQHGIHKRKNCRDMSSHPARQKEPCRQQDANVKDGPGGGQHSSASRRARSLWPCHALDGQGDHPASPRVALRRRQLADLDAARVTPIATGVAAAPDPRAHRQPHDIQQTRAGHSQSFNPEGSGSRETDELGASPARRSREQRQGLALLVKIVGQPDRMTAFLLPADAPSPGNCDNRGQPPIEMTCQGADGLGRMRRTRRQNERFRHLPRILANQTAICRPGGRSGSEVVIRPSVRASAGKREVEWLVPCTFQGPRLDDGLGPKSIQPPNGLVHHQVSAGARNSLKRQKAARPEGSGDQWPCPQSHPVETAPPSGENRLDGIPGMGRHARRVSRPLHGQRRQSPFPDKPSSPPLFEATAQLHYPSSNWGCSAAESRCRA